MKIKPLGRQGLTASEIGLGCMGMSEFYGKRDDEHSLQTLQRAYDLGIRFWDTADAYGPHHNEMLIGKALKGIRPQITLCTKFGIVRDPQNPSARGINGKPSYVQAACEASLRRLGVETIDLYYLHRADPATPIEETVGAMSRLVEQGKVRGIGLSEVNVNTLKKAHGVHPVSALQSEYSLWSRDPEDGVLETCASLGIAFVAYSPLGRGFLTGQLRKFEDLPENDWRRFSPRFQGENFNKNLELVNRIRILASEKGCTPAQLALAWVMSKGGHIFPIPGTKQIKYLEENLGSLDVRLTAQDLSRIDAIAPPDIAQGSRYPEAAMKTVNQ